MPHPPSLPPSLLTYRLVISGSNKMRSAKNRARQAVREVEAGREDEVEEEEEEEEGREEGARRRGR